MKAAVAVPMSSGTWGLALSTTTQIPMTMIMTSMGMSAKAKGMGVSLIVWFWLMAVRPLSCGMTLRKVDCRSFPGLKASAGAGVMTRPRRCDAGRLSFQAAGRFRTGAAR